MFDKILVLAPHTDDAELGCGGTLARFIAEGRDVHYAVFSGCEDSVPAEYSKDILLQENRKAVARLNIDESNVSRFDFPVRYFPQNRQKVLERLIEYRDNLKPDLVLLPSPTDLHQDHQTITNEGMRAFKGTSIFGYEIPWNNITFSVSTFIILEKEHVEKKVKALECYESQSFRGYADPEFVFSLARTRGVQIEVPYAEAFEVLRLIVR